MYIMWDTQLTNKFILFTSSEKKKKNGAPVFYLSFLAGKLYRIKRMLLYLTFSKKKKIGACVFFSKFLAGKLNSCDKGLEGKKIL